MSVGRDYTDKDLEASLKRAFVDHGFPSILWDGHEARNPFLRDGINYGIRNGLLCVGSRVEESQYTAIHYVLTDKGKKHFGLESTIASQNITQN